MTMYFQSLFPIACPIGHNGWIEIGCPICRLYFFRDRTNIYDYVYPISIPKCLSDRIQYIRIEIGYPICIVYSFTDWIDQYFINVYVSYQISNKGIGEYKYYPIEQQAFVCAFEICVLAQMWIFTWSLTHTIIWKYNDETQSYRQEYFLS